MSANRKIRNTLRVAFIHDWLVGMRGGERCLDVLCELFPRAEIFTLFYEPQEISRAITTKRVTVSFLGKLPGVKRYYRHLLPAYDLGIADLSSRLAAAHQQEPFDVVISISHCVAKNIKVPAGVKHLCYCLTPARYLYDQYDAYFAGSKMEWIIRPIIAVLRGIDVARSSRVDDYLAISKFISDRIARVYNRPSFVIYPPVDTSWIAANDEGRPGDGFLCVSALVPYKNVKIIVSTFNKRKERLTVVGRGPELARLQAIAGPNIEFREFVNESELAALYRGTKALVFAAEEDFGIVPVEAQAAGRPVIAYGKGGVLESVAVGAEGSTGVFFTELNCDKISAAIDNFLDRENDFTVKDCVKSANRFSRQLFEDRFVDYLISRGILSRELNPGDDLVSSGNAGDLRKVC